jgi:2-polyprenyl-3-methyl-5-hydroxy-6-metoxy-1,4-benzoquinol methylase
VRLETIGCPLCLSVRDEIAIEEKGWNGRRCAACSVIFVSPRPAAGDIAALYGGDSAHVDAGCLASAPTAARLHARQVLRPIGTNARGKRLLEIGSGMGALLVEADRLGFDVTGLDLNPRQVEHVRSLGLRCELGSLESARLEGRTFDVIACCDVLSHFHDPIDSLRRMRALLAPGGIVVLETGNIPDVDPRYFPLFAEFQYPDHLFFFGESALRRMLQHVGLEVTTWERFSIVPQLTVANAIEAVARRLFRRPAVEEASAVGAQPAARSSSCVGAPALQLPRPRGPFVVLRRRLRDIATHHAAYSLGRLWPKKRRPLTLIVTARAPSSGPSVPCA